MTRNHHLSFYMVLLLCGGFTSHHAFGTPESKQVPTFTEQTQQLSDLRTEVVLLQEEIRENRLATQEQLRTLEAQKRELVLQLQRENASISELEDVVEELEQQQSEFEDSAEIEQGIQDVAAAIKEDIATGLPFRSQERIESIDSLLKERQDGSISALQLATRLWSVLDDEKRLNRENQLDSQIITLDGEEVLVDIIRLGMMFMYYQSNDGSVGYLSSNKKWVPIENSQEMSSMFTQFQKGIRNGVFVLPLLQE